MTKDKIGLSLDGDSIRDRLDEVNSILSYEKLKKRQNPDYVLGSDNPKEYRQALNTHDELEDLLTSIDVNSDSIPVDLIIQKIDYYCRKMAILHKVVSEVKEEIVLEDLKKEEIKKLKENDKESKKYNQETKEKKERKVEEKNVLPAVITGNKIYNLLNFSQKRKLLFDDFEERNNRKPSFFEKIKIYIRQKKLTENIERKIETGAIKFSDLHLNEIQKDNLFFYCDIDIDKILEEEENASKVIKVEPKEEKEDSKNKEKDKEKETPKVQKNIFSKMKKFTKTIYLEKLDEKIIDYLNKPSNIINLGIDTSENALLIELDSTKGLNAELLKKLDSKTNIFIQDGVTENLSDNKYTQQTALIYKRDELIKLFEYIENIESGIKDNWSDVQKIAYFYDWLTHHYELDTAKVSKLDEEDRIKSDRKYRSLRSFKEKCAHSTGFAIMFKELCNRQNIYCEFATGGYGENIHSWNIVKLSDRKYAIDTARASYYYHKYLDSNDNTSLEAIENLNMSNKFLLRKEFDGEDKPVWFADFNVPHPYCKTIDYTVLSGLTEEGVKSLKESIKLDDTFEIEEFDKDKEKVPDRFITVRDSNGTYEVKTDNPFRTRVGDKLIYQFNYEGEKRFADATIDDFISKNETLDVLEPSDDVQVGEQLLVNDSAEDYFASIEDFDLFNSHELMVKRNQDIFQDEDGDKILLIYQGTSKKEIDRPYQYGLFFENRINIEDFSLVLKIKKPIFTDVDLISLDSRNLLNGELIKYSAHARNIETTEILKGQYNAYMNSRKISEEKIKQKKKNNEK